MRDGGNSSRLDFQEEKKGFNTRRILRKTRPLSTQTRPRRFFRGGEGEARIIRGSTDLLFADDLSFGFERSSLPPFCVPLGSRYRRHQLRFSRFILSEGGGNGYIALEFYFLNTLTAAHPCFQRNLQFGQRARCSSIDILVMGVRIIFSFLYIEILACHMNFIQIRMFE